MLPAASFDRVFLVHMYHEVEQPYAFLWHLREGVKPDGLVVVVDSNRPVKQHGMPLNTRLAALGLPYLSDCPEVTVDFVDRDAPPFDPGELGAVAVAPAVANALFSATGVRFRRLPLLSEDV